MKLSISVYSAVDTVTTLQKEELTKFLHKHLQEYGDPQEDILRSIEYALSDRPHQGGFVIVARHENKIVGAVVINHSNMSGYIPENVLVYIATHSDYRGQGLGKKLMQTAIDRAKGDIALHVERDNPARHLYEKMGFTSPYIEMRYKREK